MGERILLKSPLNPLTGYGRDGIGLAMALENLGAEVMLSPVNLTPPLPRSVALMLTRPLEAPFDVLINHVDPVQIALTDGDRRSSYRTVVWTMWEYLDFTPPLAEVLRERLPGFTHVVAYDPTTATALEPFVGEGQKTFMLQGGYDPEPWESDPSDRDWGGTIRFGMAGALDQRKNPFAAVRAFERVHEIHPDTELHLKTIQRTLHPKMEERYPGLHIHYAMWGEEQLLAFYRSLHAYVGPSWGEGKNLPAIEAATTGAVPIVSDVGGHRMWAESDWAYVTPVTEAVHDGLRYGAVDEEALFQQMLRVVEHREEAREKGMLAARVLPAMLNWDRVAQNLLAGIR